MIPFTDKDKESYSNKKTGTYAKKNLIMMMIKSIIIFKTTVITQVNKEKQRIVFVL